ncbi:MAG: TonB-dependent receptor [Bradymonadaceae bacterium]|nr:TonB-dependent receptor [Lujinxingiaceae bacterium]
MRRLRFHGLRWALSALLLCCTVTLSSSAFADEPTRSASADEAEVEFRLGNDAYRASNFERALSHYFASNRLVYNRNVVFNIAKCYENLGRFVEAYRYYRTYLEGVASDAERTQVEVALARIDKRVGVIHIESDPPGATIYIDRLDLGNYGVTPQHVPVSPGEYRIILEKDGWESSELKAMSVTAGGLVQGHANLIRREGTISLSGQPSTLTVSISPDGTPIELELPAQLPAPVGTQTLLLSAPGFESTRLTLDVQERSSVEALVSLRRQTGTLVITASELNSAVLLDGVLVGFTPVVIPNVAVGSHRVSVVQEGFESSNQLVELASDDRFELEATLTPLTEVAAASRVAESVRDAPASVSLISSREIEAFSYIGTADAIQGMRGVYYTNDMTYRFMGIRGYGPFGQFGNRTQVQLDGHTLNESWVEGSYHQFEVLSDIYGLDRIELVRGPNSLLYGSGAFQGVINLVSPEIDDPYRASRAGVTAVSDGVVRAYSHYRHPFEGGGLQLSAGLAGGQGRDFFSPARVGSEAHPTGLASNVGDFDAATVRANAKWRNFKLYSYLHNRDQQSAAGNYDVLFGDPRARERDRRGYVDARYDDPSDDPLTFNTRIYYDYYGYQGSFPYEIEQGGLFRDNFRGHWAGAEGRTVLRPFEGARWTLGADLVRHFVNVSQNLSEEDNSILESSNPFWKTSVHAIARHDFGRRFAIMAGARYDLWLFDSLPDPESGEGSRQIGAASPRLVLLGRPVDDGTLKLMAGTGFRAPSVYELTYNDGGLTQVAAPGLDPETIYSGELEYTHVVGGGFELVGAVFANRIGTRIEQSGSGNEEDPLQFVNIAEALWSTGAEFELRRPFLRGWMASAQYSYQRTREGSLESLWSTNTPLANSPGHIAAIKFVAPIAYPAIQMANRLLYEAPRLDRNGDETRHVLIWDLTFAGQLAALPVRYAAGVRNLLDWRYDHPVGDEILDVSLAQPGRTFIVDISAQF